MNNLSQKMQERLDKWMSKPPQLTNKPPAKMNNFVARGDWGDDLRDYYQKDADAWQKQYDSNPIYRR